MKTDLPTLFFSRSLQETNSFFFLGLIRLDDGKTKD